jgi:outer membrane immunogenic protein
MWNIGGRLGYLLSENTLAFVRVAYASLDADISGSGLLAGIPAKVDNLDGVQFGLGVEHHIGHNFTLRGEYVYSDYGSADISITGTGNVAEVDVTSGEGRVELSYSF